MPGWRRHCGKAASNSANTYFSARLFRGGLQDEEKANSLTHTAALTCLNDGIVEFAQLEYRMYRAPLVAYEQLAEVAAVSGVYTAWLRGEEAVLYVGRSKHLHRRIRAHFSGQRGSDQFCLYVYDRYVFEQRPPGLMTAEVNRLTADWIRSYVQFRWVAVPVEEAGPHEEALRRWWKPMLNPL